MKISDYLDDKLFDLRVHVVLYTTATINVVVSIVKYAYRSLKCL